MDAKLSPQIRIASLIGLLAAIALAVWFFLLGGSGTSTPEVKTIKPLHPVKKAGTAAPPAVKKPAKPAAKRATPAKPVKKAPAKPKPAPPAKPKPLANPNGLPIVIARALARNPVVVVSLYSPEAEVDELSLGEAEAGARDAGPGVGFVPLNVLDQRQSAALTKKLGVLSNPALFVYRRPGDLIVRIDGFADRDLVAQAAVIALPVGLPGRALAASGAKHTVGTDWVSRVNGICLAVRREQEAVGLTAGASRAEFLAKAPKYYRIEKRAIARISAIQPPANLAPRVRVLVGLWRQVLAAELEMVAAVRKGNAAAVTHVYKRARGLVSDANGKARSLGVPACASSSTSPGGA